MMRHLPAAARLAAVVSLLALAACGRDDGRTAGEKLDAATAAGAEATLVEVPGGHFGVIDPTSQAWAACVEVLDSIG